MIRFELDVNEPGSARLFIYLGGKLGGMRFVAYGADFRDRVTVAAKELRREFENSDYAEAVESAGDIEKELNEAS